MERKHRIGIAAAFLLCAARANGRASASLNYESGTYGTDVRALVEGEPSPRDLRAVLDFRLDERASLFASALAGLSEGSADYGFGFGATLRF